ncbi:MAG: hypothetical protein IKW57_02005 [Alphaproteobacteria bacterium]|nr:hypothetical protein [Alphaproteobacteria bacterium]
MKNRVEPPILISRMMTFVMATALVVLGVLVITLAKLFPLNKPQVFFLTTTVRAEQDVRLVELQPRDANLDRYKRAFVREYIRLRNEVFTNANAMHKTWNSENGEVRIMSTDQVYADFAKTTMFTALMSEMPDFDFTCPVVFEGAPIYLASEDRYQVKFRYFCADSTGRTWPKDYTIKIKLTSDQSPQIKWTDRIENPLGLRVQEYTVVEGDGDPLNTGFLATE